MLSLQVQSSLVLIVKFMNLLLCEFLVQNPKFLAFSMLIAVFFKFFFAFFAPTSEQEEE